ncbi:ISL3 family transposase, partial [Staphylococcus pseudintermedius]
MHRQYSSVHNLLTLNDTIKATDDTVHRLLSDMKANDIQKIRISLRNAKTKDATKVRKRVIHTFIKYMPNISSTRRHRHLTNGHIEGIN